MDAVRFEWDEDKNHSNMKKHGVSFEEGSSVFYDASALVRDDPDHSNDEERFIIMGMSFKARLLIVCHCYRVSDSVIRIFSARKATKTETSQYRNR